MTVSVWQSWMSCAIIKLKVTYRELRVKYQDNTWTRRKWLAIFTLITVKQQRFLSKKIIRTSLPMIYLKLRHSSRPLLLKYKTFHVSKVDVVHFIKYSTQCSVLLTLIVTRAIWLWKEWDEKSAADGGMSSSDVLVIALYNINLLSVAGQGDNSLGSPCI